jgi:hypothetical protein
VEESGSYVRRITKELKVKEKRNRMLRKRRQISEQKKTVREGRVVE